jgi:hypothetical protein
VVNTDNRRWRVRALGGAALVTWSLGACADGEPLGSGSGGNAGKGSGLGGGAGTSQPKAGEGGKSGRSGASGTGGDTQTEGGAPSNAGEAGATAGEAGAPATSECTDCSRRLSAGGHRTCFVQASGQIACWGANDYVENLAKLSDVALPPAGSYEQVALGEHGSWALDSKGSIKGWGTYWESREEDDFSMTSDLKVPLDGVYDDLSAGCSLRANGTSNCGSFEGLLAAAGRYGLDGDRQIVQLLAGGPAGVTLPAGHFLSISNSFPRRHACGVREDGTLACWGTDAAGETTPPPGTFKSVSTGVTHTCAIRDDDTVSCWGDPLLTAAPSGRFREVSSGVTHSCGLRFDDRVVCWGLPHDLQLDVPSAFADAAPRFTQLSAGGDASHEMTDLGYELTGKTGLCGIDEQGKIHCSGALIDQPPNGTFVAVSTGAGAACAIRSDGLLECWGALSLPEGEPAEAMEHVSVGHALACAVSRAGAIRCWDFEPDADSDSERTPPGVPPQGVFTSVHVSHDADLFEPDGLYVSYPRACALRSDGAVHCWGNGPGFVGGVEEGPFTQVVIGRAGVHALSADGTARRLSPTYPPQEQEWAGRYLKIGVGDNPCGLLMDGKATCDFYSAAQIPEDTFVDLSVADDFACGLRSDGDYRCFGTRIH